MSRLNDLLRQLDTKDAALAADLRREVDALADRRAFGLNFERHVPEAVELPGRKVRKGDKVRVLPPRGQNRTAENDTLWRVAAITTDTDGIRTAQLELLDGSDQSSASIDDVVVVAEFRDPIYPGLVSTGKVERGGDRPFHTVINAENFHALQTLLYTHRGKVDCIYIDPPYNTGAKDWKYNNDYVEGDDLYRHSKWLAFMERRLLLAKELLKPDDSVLIVTIDEKEYLRLGLLLEQTFPDARIQMITSVISQKGSARAGEFSRCNEYIFFVMVGDAAPLALNDDMLHDSVTDEGDEVEWGRLKRNGANGRRDRSANLFYPIFLNEDGTFHSTGEPLPKNKPREDVETPPGTVAVFPVLTNGQEMSWGLSREKLESYIPHGYVKFGAIQRQKHQKAMIYYLTSGYVEAAVRGEISNVGTAAAPKWVHTTSKGMRPMTVWNKVSHDAGWHGSRLLDRFIPGRNFPYAKSLFAVEDTLRFFLAKKPHATVMDFFSGSGTTTHAVMRLNRQDGGTRTSIIVTNNEVSADSQNAFWRQGLRPGDPDWEAQGICEFITKPRIRAAVTGRTPDGIAVKGEYKFNDDFPMADGLEENAEFFTLTYEAPLRVSSNREFARIAPLLWLRAGSRGRRIEDVTSGWDVADIYGVLADLDQSEQFVKAVVANEQVTTAFIVTDEDRLFQALVRELPDHVECVRLYESYLRNFEIESGRSVR